MWDMLWKWKVLRVGELCCQSSALTGCPTRSPARPPGAPCEGEGSVGFLGPSLSPTSQPPHAHLLSLGSRGPGHSL